MTISLLAAPLLAHSYELSVDADGLITMRSGGEPVEVLVSAIGRELGIEVSFPSPVPERVSVDFEGMKLEQAIKQITSSYILVKSKNALDPQVREIIVMSEGGEGSNYLPQEVPESQIQEETAAVEEVPLGSGENTMTPTDMARQVDLLRRRQQAGAQDELPEGADPAQGYDEAPPEMMN
ncbi:hypothetical protein Q4485_17485 [Granulosicoccaceae sp. 1_MG-2023]|nr:hypothetical protein [Granulosicoccaceae sp. 1_MG-2023]